MKANAAMVLEILGYLIIALVVLGLWYALPFFLLRLAMVVFYISFVRMIWRRG